MSKDQFKTLRTTPDGAGYRCLIDQPANTATARFTIERHSAGTDTWTPIQQWDTECAPRSRERRLMLTMSARDHGWHLMPDQWPRSHRGLTILDQIHPENWSLILSEVTARRNALIDQFSRLDAAWQGVIVAALDIGHLTRAQVADASDVSPSRIYQIRTAESEPDAEDRTQVVARASAHRRSQA